MANTGSGNVKKADVDQLFEVYFNGGQRRTYVEVEAYTKQHGIPDASGCSNATIRRYAEEFDWRNRADAIDAETRMIRDRRVADIVAQTRVREIEALASLGVKFMRRLIPSTADRPNPAELQPEDIQIGDFFGIIKSFELLTGGATERVGEETTSRLDEMERAIALMDARERETVPALTAGEDEQEVVDAT